MKPVLTALGFGSAIPGDAECLVTTAGEFDQSCLQGYYAKGIGDRMVSQLTVRPIGSLPKMTIPFKEGRQHAIKFKCKVVKIPSTVFSLATCMANA